MPATKPRYRPAFSEEEVEVLATILLEAYLADITEYRIPHIYTEQEKLIHQGLIGKINTLRTKIANNALNPAYVVRKHSDPAIAMLEDLGADETEVDALAGGETKEAYWTRCYWKYMETPNVCTVPEIEAAMEYKYLHDLMTPEEVATHEGKAN